MDQQDISYALAKQVPDMFQLGFVIGTRYGDLTIQPGQMSERIAIAVRKELERELARIGRDFAKRAQAVDAAPVSQS